MTQDAPGATDSTVPASPVDDHTYNVLQALTSTLESIEAYERYKEDRGGEFFAPFVEDERRHAEMLVQELRGCLG
jgi:hypothetical protein